MTSVASHARLTVEYIYIHECPILMYGNGEYWLDTVNFHIVQDEHTLDRFSVFSGPGHLPKGPLKSHSPRISIVSCVLFNLIDSSPFPLLSIRSCVNPCLTSLTSVHLYLPFSNPYPPSALSNLSSPATSKIVCFAHWLAYRIRLQPYTSSSAGLPSSRI
jgi:hypothetical protein